MALLRRTPGGSWEVRYRDPSGRQRSRSLRRKTDADGFAVTVEADKLGGEWMDPRLARVTFADFAQEWFDGIDSRADLATNTHAGVPLRPRAPAPPVVRPDAGVDQGRGGACAAWTVRSAYSDLRLVFDEALERGVVLATPCVRPGLPPAGQKDMTPLSLDQLEALVTEVTHHAWQSSWPARPACATPSCPSCLDQGIDLDVISRWLGHSSPVITRKTYTRLLASTEERAAQALESAVRAANERRAEGFLWDERAIRAAAQAPQTTKTASDLR